MVSEADIRETVARMERDCGVTLAPWQRDMLVGIVRAELNGETVAVSPLARRGGRRSVERLRARVVSEVRGMHCPVTIVDEAEGEAYVGHGD